jgi:hypothetical protein
MENRRPPLSKKHVLSWLSRFKPDETVGIARNEDTCPLSCYLREQRGYMAPRVYKDSWETGGVFSYEYALPDWAVRFIARIDKRGRRGLTRDEAIRHLERA